MLIVTLMSTLIGISLGLLGGGGSILAVPVLTYGAGLPAKEAIATSLIVVGTTALFALLPHARRGDVEWRTGFIFSSTAMVGAYLGGFAAVLFSGTTLLLLFAAMMVATAFAMFRGRVELEVSKKKPLSIGIVVAEGLVVGGVTGLLGAGGGFLVVPALVLIGGMEMHKAVGTSLLVIGLKSFAAFTGYVTHVSVQGKLTLVVTAAAIVGTFLGSQIAMRITGEVLRKTFSCMVLVMAGFVIWQEAGLLSALVLMSFVFSVLLWKSYTGRWSRGKTRCPKVRGSVFFY